MQYLRLRRMRVAGFLILFSCISFFSSEAFSETQAFGDAFVTSSIAEPSNLIPFFASDSASAEISRLIFNGLVKYDANLKLTGDLAERWEIKDGGRVIVFYLKKNVKWQDGMPLTAHDVEFTFQKLTDPGVPTPYGADFEKIKSVKVLDEGTVEVDYKEPFSPGLASWTMGIVPRHILSGENMMNTSFSRRPVGTGPYLLKKWITGQRLELWANPAYFEGRPHIQRYVCRVIPDPATAFLELETGTLDMASLNSLQFTKQTKIPFFEKNFVKFRYAGFGYTYLGYNLENPLFSDKRVRKAIGLAIHKKEIVNVVLRGMGRVATGPFLPASWAHDPAVAESRFDPVASRALLKEAGWVPGADGILQKAGKKFSFTILTHQGGEDRKMACEMIQKRLKDVGIDMKIQVIEWGVFLREFIAKKRFEAVLLAWQLGPDPDLYDIFHSSRIRSGGFNFVSFKNAQADRLLEEGRRIFPEEERAKIYHKLHRLLAEEEPYTFLYVPDSLAVLHKRFHGVKVAPAGIGYNFTHWFVPKEEQKYKLKN